jgi:Mn-containing catalase
LYFNFSNGNDYRGPWNEGKSTEFGETYQYIADPIKHVMETDALLNQKAQGTDRTEQSVQKLNKKISKIRSEEVNSASPVMNLQWNNGKKIGSANGNSKSKISKKITAPKSGNGQKK